MKLKIALPAIFSKVETTTFWHWVHVKAKFVSLDNFPNILFKKNKKFEVCTNYIFLLFYRLKKLFTYHDYISYSLNSSASYFYLPDLLYILNIWTWQWQSKEPRNGKRCIILVGSGFNVSKKYFQSILNCTDFNKLSLEWKVFVTIYQSVLILLV